MTLVHVIKNAVYPPPPPPCVFNCLIINAHLDQGILSLKPFQQSFSDPCWTLDAFFGTNKNLCHPKETYPATHICQLHCRKVRRWFHKGMRPSRSSIRVFALWCERPLHGVILAHFELHIKLADSSNNFLDTDPATYQGRGVHTYSNVIKRE